MNHRKRNYMRDTSVTGILNSASGSGHERSPPPPEPPGLQNHGPAKAARTTRTARTARTARTTKAARPFELLEPPEPLRPRHYDSVEPSYHWEGQTRFH